MTLDVENLYNEMSEDELRNEYTLLLNEFDSYKSEYFSAFNRVKDIKSYCDEHNIDLNIYKGLDNNNIEAVMKMLKDRMSKYDEMYMNDFEEYWKIKNLIKENLS